MITENPEKKAAIDLRKSKSEGFEYKGVMVPVTNEDATGALQMAYGFEQKGMPATTFDMSNGVGLPLTLEEWPEFSDKFFEARNSFFNR